MKKNNNYQYIKILAYAIDR